MNDDLRSGVLDWGDLDDDDVDDDCPICNGTGYIPQDKALDRWYGRQRCECHPDYDAETERLRAYS